MILIARERVIFKPEHLCCSGQSAELHDLNLAFGRRRNRSRLSANRKLSVVCSPKLPKDESHPVCAISRTNLTLPLLICRPVFLSSVSCVTFQNVRQCVQHSLIN